MHGLIAFFPEYFLVFYNQCIQQSPRFFMHIKLHIIQNQLIFTLAS